MRPLSGMDILTAWESGRELPEQEAILAILSLACSERPAEELALLPLGDRNAMLLEMRALMLGPRMEGFAVCPNCAAQLEFGVNTDDLIRELRSPATSALDGGRPMRPANTLDLIATRSAEDEEQARCVLLARATEAELAQSAVLSRPHPGRAAMEWFQSQPKDLALQLMERFEALNAAAEIRVQLQCAVCHSSTELDFDVARFIMREVASLARQLMSEIHTLAAAYGWPEHSIASMSHTRRAAYLEMLSA